MSSGEVLAYKFKENEKDVNFNSNHIFNDTEENVDGDNSHSNITYN